MRVVLKRTVVGNGDLRFDNPSGSHQSQVNICCQSNVLSPVAGQVCRNVIGCKTQVA